MKFNAAIIAVTIIGYTTAVDLRLWKHNNSCSGNGIVCLGIPKETCCRQNGQLYGAAEAVGGQAGYVSAPFTKRGDLYCGVQIGSTKPIPVCFITNLDQSVGGIAWEIQGRRMKRSDQMAPCKAFVEGDEMYSDGGKMYIISKDKMAALAAQSKKPTDEKELLEYFKTHADNVIDDQHNSVVETVDAASASGQK